MPHGARALFFALGCLAAASGPAAGPAAASPGAGEADAAFAAREDISGRMIAQVMVNGQGPFPFIVDTGANRTAITRALADRLGLPAAPHARVDGVTGAQDLAFARIDALQTGEHKAGEVLAPVIETGVTSAAMGLLGAESFQRRRLELDIERGVARVTRSRRPPPRAGVVVIPGAVRLGGLFVTQGEIRRGLRVNVIIDTGAERTLANRALARALGPSWAPFSARTALRVIGSTDLVARGELGYLPPIRLGPARLGDTLAIVGDFHVFDVWGLTDAPTILLGMDVLGATRTVAIDYARRELHLTL